MKTTIDLPDALVREVKMRAVSEGRTVKDLIAEFIRQGLGIGVGLGTVALSQSSGGRVVLGEDQLPLIPCSAYAPARTMSIGELLKREQASQMEEDPQRAGQPL